ncbi:B-box domain protein 31 [Linum grandiflorum]
MCRGLLQQSKAESFCNKKPEASEAESCFDGVSSASRKCELCEEKARLYCEADDAYLCQKCDRYVHGANFLALRHVRCFLCSTCHGFTRRFLVGASMEVVLPGTMKDEEQGEEPAELPFLFL